MPTQIIQRTLGNVLVGGATQMAVDRASNPVTAKLLLGAGELGLGLVLKGVQLYGMRGRRHDFLDLGADTFASSGATTGGEALGYLVDGKLLAAPATQTSTPTTTSTPAATTGALSASAASDSAASDTLEAS